MPKGLKIAGYIAFAFISFFVFLYLTFPFEVVKDRLLDDVEKRFRGKYELTVGSISPRLIAGVTLKNVKLKERAEGTQISVVEADKVKLKASVFSLIFGSPKIKFSVLSGGGEVFGRVQSGKDEVLTGVELDEFNLSSLTYLMSKYGLNVKSRISGKVDLNINLNQIIRSSGKISIKPNTITILPSKLKAGAMGEVDLPALTISTGKSLIDAELQRGAIKINDLRLEGGDIDIDLKGSVYLSTKLDNFRLNLRGTFKFSEKLDQALPFLFIISKQKKEDGTYPITIAGRLSKPQIKIGDFNVPM